jgi:glycosyltransferase involved in cell wall biosynthesis
VSAEQPKVSVVVLTYNHAPFIEETMSSVLSQKTTFPYEVIVTEDCSTDGTREKVEEIAARDHRVRLLLSPENMNDPEVELRAFRAARGDYIAFVEGDDYWTSAEKLEHQVAFLDANTDCASSFHNARILQPDGEFAARPYCAPGQKARLTAGDIVVANVIPTCTVMFRRGVVATIPDWYRDMPVGDSTLHVVCALQGQIGYIDDVMAVYRRHAGGKWSNRDVIAQSELSIDWRAKIDRATGGRYRRAVRRGHARDYRRLARVYAEQGAKDRARRELARCLAYRLGAGELPLPDERGLAFALYAPWLGRLIGRVKGRLQTQG